jgi:diguanylate cyclase (GGDEF)-like protein
MHLQRYREIESSLGHEIGDEVLLQSAKRMRDSLKEKDVLARLEGDQFLVVLPGADKDAGLATAETLARLLDSGLTIQNINVTLDACIGMCVYPEHGRQPDELLRRAAVAKNDAQQSQKNVHVYQNGREARHVRQLAILGDMRRAATENEWELYFQPKIALDDGSVCGAEALLRWTHPELGEIPPAEFVPLAENAGNVGMLTEWVLRKAIAQARNWQEAGLELAIAVNLSGRDLLNDKLPYLIMQILRENELDARSLILEITEDALVQDIDHAIMVLKYLRDMGAKISMDDFGTGYSSLSQLQLLPVDEIKIDRAFITDLPDSEANAAIVRSVIELAHNLGLELVAEGVETVAALDWLREHGCERAQGFYISKPMPPHKLKIWVDKWTDSGNKADDSLVFLPRRPITTP